MNAAALRVLRVPLVAALVTAVLAALAPLAMAQYQPYLALRGLGGSGCFVPLRSFAVNVTARNQCTSVAETYRRPFFELLPDAALRSEVLLVGAGMIALLIGASLGVAVALMRRRAVGGGLMGAVSVLVAVPSFFVAYFLQIAVIVLGSSADGGRLLPVFGFGYDEHLILPMLALAVPAIAFTAQVTATRMTEVLDAEFMNTATAKGLNPSWIVLVHVLPHVRPAALEGLGMGLRVSVASLPIIETLFNWNGIGALGLQAVALRDVPAFVFCVFVLALTFGLLGALADLSRPRALYAAR